MRIQGYVASESEKGSHCWFSAVSVFFSAQCSPNHILCKEMQYSPIQVNRARYSYLHSQVARSKHVQEKFRWGCGAKPALYHLFFQDQKGSQRPTKYKVMTSSSNMTLVYKMGLTLSRNCPFRSHEDKLMTRCTLLGPAVILCSQ